MAKLTKSIVHTTLTAWFPYPGDKVLVFLAVLYDGGDMVVVLVEVEGVLADFGIRQALLKVQSDHRGQAKGDGGQHILAGKEASSHY